MQRDANLIRSLLLEFEAGNLGIFAKNPKPVVWLQDYPEEVVSGHIVLLIEAGLVTGSVAACAEGEIPMPGRLTNAGHDFIDAAKNPDVWGKAMAISSQAGGSLALGVLGNLLNELTAKWVEAQVQAG